MIEKFSNAVRRAGRGARKASRIRGFSSFLSGKPLRVRSAYGPYLAIRFGDATFESCADGGYGDFTARIIAGQKEPFLFLDIGANIGIYSLLASQNPHCVSVFAFEPIAESFSHLVNNITINKVTNVMPFCGALTDQDETRVLEMSFDAAHSGISRILPSSTSSARLAISLTTAFLDDLLARHKDVRIVTKIDVEGAEESVLRTLFSSSAREKISDVIVEVSSMTRDGVEPVGITELLESNGFVETGRRGHSAHYDAHFVREHEIKQASSSLNA